ncbi:MAG: type II secretion system F family protein, partial [Elusimicrobiota bacterium]|nr:type II secretion system F family protein [Elusimicrobiota bacterium]
MIIFIYKYLAILFFFGFGVLIFYFILSHIKIKKDIGEISVFEKNWIKYKNTILEFNFKVGKIKLKEKFIPIIYIIITFIFGFILYLITKTFLFFIFVFGFLYYLPGFILNTIKRNRRAKIEKQLVSALIFLGNAMKAGLDIVQGLELAIKNLEPPIQEEFIEVLKEYHLGTSLEEGLINMRQRIQSKPIDTFVTSIIIQRETGGDITKIIEQIISSVRETYKLEKKVQTLTSQGRIQAIIVTMLPWILGGILLAIQPDFMLPMFKTTL